MTIEEFSEECGIKVKSIRKRIDEIKGISHVDGVIVILEGSRYPYNLRRSRIDTRLKKMNVLLNATDHNRYIDEKTLHMSKNSFKTMVEELVRAKLLISNGSNNSFGVNMYDVSLAYSECKKRNRTIMIQNALVAAGIIVQTFSLMP